MEEQLYSFSQFPDSKNHWEGKFFLNFFVSRNIFKREIFVNFLPQNFKIKYDIVSTYSVNFVSQKILACFQCYHNPFGFLFIKYKTSYFGLTAYLNMFVTCLLISLPNSNMI